MRKSFARLALAAVFCALLVPGTSAASEVNCADHDDPRIDAMNDTGIGLTGSLGLAPGRYALPVSSQPTVLVVMFHGHGNDSCSWRRHLQKVAARGAIGVAMDYTGQYLLSNGSSYGWYVKEGAADSIAAAKYFMAAYSSISTVIAFGVSMGGNASGLAVASPSARRSSGGPLFDYWISVEGVNNLIEEYLVARAIAPVNGTAALAVAEIHEENGGSLEENPSEYIATTNIARAADMAGLRGAVIVHGLDDGLVPTDQSPQMTAALTAVGVPTHQYTVLLRGSGEAGTTGTGIVAGPLFGAAGQTYQSPLAGHGWEGSDTHLVIQAGFDALYQLIAGGDVDPGATVVPGV